MSEQREIVCVRWQRPRGQEDLVVLYDTAAKVDMEAWAFGNAQQYTAEILARKRMPDVTAAMQDVTAERYRQRAIEGFSTDGDDKYVGFELVKAAVCYAQAASWKDKTRQENRARAYPPGLWPWADHWWKPAAVDDRRRDLVKAGALILAEIERLDRAAEKAGGDA